MITQENQTEELRRKNDDIISKLFSALAKLRKAIKKYMEKHKEDSSFGNVFEKKIDDIEKQLDNLDDQDAVFCDCLRDVADKMEKISGVIEGGDMNKSEIIHDLNDLDNMMAEIKNNRDLMDVLHGKDLDTILKQSFDKDIFQKIYKKDRNNKKVLSSDVEFLISKEQGKAELYLKIDNEAVQISRKPNDGPITRDSIVFSTKQNIETKDNKFFLDKSKDGKTFEKLRLSKNLSITDAIGKALLKTENGYLNAREEKKNKIRNEARKISGTKAEPFELDNFHSFYENNSYSIKDRHHNDMITFKYAPETHTMTATYAKLKDAKGFEPDGEPIEVMKLQSLGNMTRYNFSTNPRIDKLLECELSKRWLDLCGIKKEHYNAMRHIPDDKLPGEHLSGMQYDKIEMLRSTLEDKLRSTKGFENFMITTQKVPKPDEDQTKPNENAKDDKENRNGEKHKDSERKTTLTITTPNDDKLILSFDKSANITYYSWNYMNENDDILSIPVAKANGKNADKILSPELFKDASFMACYSAVKDAIRTVEEKSKGSGDFTYGTSNIVSDINAVETISFVKAAAAYAFDGIKAERSTGELNPKRLENTIINEFAKQTEKYPPEQVRTRIAENYENIMSLLATQNVIDSAKSGNITYVHPDNGQKDHVKGSGEKNTIKQQGR